MARTSPTPVAAHLHGASPSGDAPTLALRQAAWEASYERRENFLFYPNEEIIRFVARYIRKQVGPHAFRDVATNLAHRSTTLDLGCGIGRHMVFGLQMGLDMHGIDLSQKAVDTAVDWLTAMGCEDASSRVHRGDAQKLPWPDGFFRFGFSHGVLDSMPVAAAKNAVTELSRVLADDARFYCDLIAGEDGFDGEVVVSGAHEEGTIQSYFTEEKMDALFSPCFETLEVTLVSREDRRTGTAGHRLHLVLTPRAKPKPPPWMSPAAARALTSVIEEMNLQLPAKKRLTLHPDQVLMGEGSVLDSVGLLSFLAAAEEALRAAGMRRPDLIDLVTVSSPERLTMANVASAIRRCETGEETSS